MEEALDLWGPNSYTILTLHQAAPRAVVFNLGHMCWSWLFIITVSSKNFAIAAWEYSLSCNLDRCCSQVLSLVTHCLTLCHWRPLLCAVLLSWRGFPLKHTCSPFSSLPVWEGKYLFSYISLWVFTGSFDSKIAQIYDLKVLPSRAASMAILGWWG